MIRPQKAPVRPRVYVRDSPETMLLEDVVPLLRERSAGMVAIVGPWGAGKTTALAHLADRFSDDARIVAADDATQAAQAAATGRLVLFTSRAATPPVADECLRLAPWGQDELIEYLLAAHRSQCGSVMDRLARAEDRQSIPGLPELWRIVLDRMADDESLTTVRDALVRELDSRLPNLKIRKLAEDFSRDSLCGDERARKFAFRKLSLEGDRVTRLMRLLGHRIIRSWLAADNFAGQLKADAPCVFLTWRLPLDLIEVLADRVSGDDGILNRLRGFAEGTKPQYHSTTATILHTTGCGWVPKRKPAQPQPEADTRDGWRKSMRRRKPKVQPKRIWLDLAGASLPAATWPGIDLIWAGLTNVDFTAADLTGAALAYSDAQGACFRRAILVEADLSELAASGADFTSADLSRSRARHTRFDAANLTEANLSQASLGKTDFAGADLTGARLIGALLKEANFRSARIKGANFSDANLAWADLSGLTLRDATFAGATFQGAKLPRADLEFMQLPAALFKHAHLTEAWLTGSVMPGACFYEACLVRAGLSDIDWEKADLRGADLRQASFHMGSSRSGLVDSPIASEGSRTGFYTDDFSQQHFKAPEEIRKANLRGADLRGANIEDTDFYLVDLRDALYTPKQGQHFRKCGAILEDRTRDAI